MQEWTEEEKSIAHQKYGCQILLQKTTLELVNDPTFPNDAYLIWYAVDNTEYLDMCRSEKTSSLFDMYYDKYGAGSVKKIDFGYGKVSPKFWGYKSTEVKKKK
jgi:hypothetical protein